MNLYVSLPKVQRNSAFSSLKCVSAARVYERVVRMKRLQVTCTVVTCSESNLVKELDRIGCMS